MPLRIAHLIESDGPGGAERVVAELARALQKSGAHSVAFLPAHGEGWLAHELEGSGVEIEHFSIDRPVSFACVRSIAAAFRRRRVALAHSHEFSMAIYGAAAARLAGIPHIATMHGGRYYAGRWQRRVALRAAFSMSARVVGVSDTVSRDLRRSLWFSRTVTVPNGVRAPGNGCGTLRSELGLDEHAGLALAIGNLYPVKGHRHLVEAFGAIARKHPTLHLAIAGRGQLKDELQSQAAALELADRVHLLGLRADVSSLLAAADVFIQPSLSEGLPLAVLEAMFAGVPIVASAVGEVPVALAHGDAGVLVPPANAAALADAIDRVLSDEGWARAMGARARQFAAGHYSMAHMVERYAQMYADVLLAA